jgi:Aminoglycoside-2''''-adenylyltransferase.
MKLIEDLCEHLAGINIDWHLCGGYAIDAYIGKETRQHKDLDITVSFDDMKECIEYLKAKGWEIDAPVGNGRLVSIDYALEHNELHFNNIWCYRKNPDFISIEKTDGVFKYANFLQREQIELDFIEVLFNHIVDGNFIYKRNHLITLSTDKAFIKKKDVSILAPELVLLYKSTNYTNTDYTNDFNMTKAKLEKERYDWFSSAMNIEYPQGHVWMDV